MSQKPQNDKETDDDNDNLKDGNESWSDIDDIDNINNRNENELDTLIKIKKAESSKTWICSSCNHINSIIDTLNFKCINCVQSNKKNQSLQDINEIIELTTTTNKGMFYVIIQSIRVHYDCTKTTFVYSYVLVTNIYRHKKQIYINTIIRGRI